MIAVLLRTLSAQSDSVQHKIVVGALIKLYDGAYSFD